VLLIVLLLLTRRGLFAPPASTLVWDALLKQIVPVASQAVWLILNAYLLAPLDTSRTTSQSVNPAHPTANSAHHLPQTAPNAPQKNFCTKTNAYLHVLREPSPNLNLKNASPAWAHATNVQATLTAPHAPTACSFTLV
jgi:hypothetical protein